MTLTDIAGRPTISVPEAGVLLGIGRDAAYAAAAAGQIPVLKLGRSLRVPVPKLLELLGAPKNPQNSEAGVGTPASATIHLADQCPHHAPPGG
jgi:excisionase family DNA binding protein